MLRLAELPSLAAVLLLFEVGSAHAQVVHSSSAQARALDGVAKALPESPLFRDGVELVPLDVCVRSRDGRPVSGLKPEDFLILENNVPQRLALFSAEGPVRLAVTILLDTSASMAGPRLARAKVAAAGFLTILRPLDLVEIISFNERVNLAYPFGMDHERAKRSLTGVAAGGMTRLYDALLVALHRFDRAYRGTDEYRNVMVLLSDGDDTGSVLTFDEVLDDARRSGVLVYAISLRTNRKDNVVAPPWQMTQLAHDTGGRAVAVRDLADLDQIYQNIAAELFQLYRLGYVPTARVHDGSWRPVSVRVVMRDLVIRTRSGYYAPRASADVRKGAGR